MFGSLKARARARFDLHAMDNDKDLTISGSIAILLDAWGCVGNKEVLEAWVPLIE
jgi:hypothetical protein